MFLPSASHRCGSGFSFWLWRGSGSYQYSDPDPIFTLMWIRIRILHTLDAPGPGWALRSNFEPPQLKYEPTKFHCEPLERASAAVLPSTFSLRCGSGSSFSLCCRSGSTFQIFHIHADPDPQHWFLSHNTGPGSSESFNNVTKISKKNCGFD